MDIITHTLSGIASSTMVASLSKKGLGKKGVVIFCGGIGGVLPDIDAVSLWSHFDRTIGTFFHLSHKGREIYFGNYWLSHHNFAHSLVGGLMITACLILLSALAVMAWSKSAPGRNIFKWTGIYWLALYLGDVMHLVGDLPTPGHTWGGIKLFWPLPVAIGGTGQIWWWNNYDLFVIIVVCCALNLGLVFFDHFLEKPFVKHLPFFICIVSLLVILYQIDQRKVNFAYTGYTKRYDEYERKSVQIQKEILDDKLYRIMRTVDYKLPLNF